MSYYELLKAKVNSSPFFREVTVYMLSFSLICRQIFSHFLPISAINGTTKIYTDRVHTFSVTMHQDYAILFFTQNQLITGKQKLNRLTAAKEAVIIAEGSYRGIDLL